MKKKSDAKETKKVVARRKTCSANGTGLSHYIVVDNRQSEKK